MLSFGEKEFYKELLEEIKKKAERIVRNIMIPITIIFCLSFTSLKANIKRSISYKKNSVTIEKYNEEIEKYANSIRNMNYSDLDIFVKLISDYNDNKTQIVYKDNEPYDCERINVFNNNKGSYTSIADDVAAKLNKINPDFNAKKITVEYNEKYANPDKKFAQKIIPNVLKDNHDVTIAEIRGKIILIDVPNNIIGVIKDGNVLLLDDDIKYTIEINPFENYKNGGIKKLSQVNEICSKSYNTTESELDLKNQYGKEAQQKSYQKIKRKSY